MFSSDSCLPIRTGLCCQLVGNHIIIEFPSLIMLLSIKRFYGMKNAECLHNICTYFAKNTTVISLYVVQRRYVAGKYFSTIICIERSPYFLDVSSS